jgi:peptidoglycan LD-endopeptidase LytH
VPPTLPPWDAVTALRRIKPGWYVLVALLAYSALASVALNRANAEARDLRTRLVAQAMVQTSLPASAAPAGLWLPVPGARVPQDAAHLPGATREGFEFHSGDAGVPISYGTPVIAAADGVVTRLDRDYQELDEATWNRLVAGEASEEGRDALRGRQIWLMSDGGLELRYGHLAAVREGLTVGARVYRGQVIGYVGNSGTEDAALGSARAPRLYFAVRDEGGFLGEGQSEADVRARAAALFVGP